MKGMGHRVHFTSAQQIIVLKGTPPCVSQMIYLLLRVGRGPVTPHPITYPW